MIKLLVDTSNKEIGIGLFNNKKCLFEKYYNTDKTYNRQIMPMIKEAVCNVKMDINNIDLFGATLGPGSFTGIRVGNAVMRALSHGLHKKFYGVSVIDILLKSVNINMNKIVLMDAGRNEFYFSYYDIKEPEKIINYEIYDYYTDPTSHCDLKPQCECNRVNPLTKNCTQCSCYRIITAQKTEIFNEEIEKERILTKYITERKYRTVTKYKDVNKSREVIKVKTENKEVEVNWIFGFKVPFKLHIF